MPVTGPSHHRRYPGKCDTAGFLSNLGTGADFTVIKFLGSSGDEIWRQVIDAGGDEYAQVVTVDGAGDVLAASMFTAIKFSRRDGTELWRQLTNGYCAAAIAVDGAGDVVSAGSISGFLIQVDFTVIKLHGTDGTDF